MLCTHRTMQKQSHQIETCRAWLEYTIEFDTLPQPCEYTFQFSTGTGLYLLVSIKSLSRSLHLLRLINGKNISSSFALGVCVNIFCQVLCSRYLLQSHTSRSSQILKPQDSRIYVLHASNTSSVKECMCCTAVHFDFNLGNVPNQQTSILLATTMPP